ncbi:SmpA / OmlA family protein [Hartmannibacter diazotrophicus]|uniref:SmpA / OmlA family protein n=2 Tax=Hartmannibacter diazotrophicus TaxID=1482074 RepID=A0A2C9D9D2_9HYPH|nr:SmpA / OmlA family protein [Hartmannibacter diazotrophicus]
MTCALRSTSIKTSIRTGALVLGLTLALGACGAPPLQHGFVMPENGLEQVPVGSSEEQVLLVFGTPTTQSSLNGKTYYYITQVIDENPLMGRSITDQRVLAIYFNDDNTVSRIGEYGLKDGRVFDFITRKTPTTGTDLNLISQILNSKPAMPF